MDCGASFKYVAAELAEKYRVIAPDWRGFGDSDHAPGGYWFADYFADLEVILDYFQPRGSVDLIGHSMGGNIAMLYAGIRPQRVARVMSLDALGLPDSEPAEAATKYRRWLDQLAQPQEARVFPHIRMLQHSLHRNNPRMPIEVVEELAALWSRAVDESGAVELKHDQRHRRVNPVRYNYEDTLSIWREATARIGLVMAGESRMFREWQSQGRIDEVMNSLSIQPADYYEIDDCGHMLHLEQPQKTAEILLDFLSR